MGSDPGKTKKNPNANSIQCLPHSPATHFLFFFLESFMKANSGMLKVDTKNEITFSILVVGCANFSAALVRLRVWTLATRKQLEPPIQCNLIRFMKYKYLMEVFLFIYLIISTEMEFGKMQLWKIQIWKRVSKTYRLRFVSSHPVAEDNLILQWTNILVQQAGLFAKHPYDGAYCYSYQCR